jgi:hypothetical protein
MFWSTYVIFSSLFLDMYTFEYIWALLVFDYCLHNVTEKFSSLTNSFTEETWGKHNS